MANKKNTADEVTAQVLFKKLGRILTGEPVTPLPELFEPLKLTEPGTFRKIGIIDDPITRQLYSFGFELAEIGNSIPLPRKPGDIDEFDAMSELITNVKKIVADIFAEKIREEFPDEALEDDADTNILRGWLLVEMNPEVEEKSVKIALDGGRVTLEISKEQLEEILEEAGGGTGSGS
jgi:hypothetical protein